MTMGRRGPPPKPTALKIVAGNPGRRPLNDREPKPEPGAPRCPAWIDKEAKACWKDLVPKLASMGVLTKIDGQALTAYCQTWSRWKQAEVFIQKHGPTYALKDEDGRLKYVQQWPQISIARSLLQMLHRYQAEFGMTPSARSRVQTNTVKVETDGKDKSRFFRAG